MALSSDETYVQTYQKYLKHKESSDDLRKLTPSHTASTKVLKPVIPDKDCKICRVLSKPGDLCRVLNQGLYHKYTSSQDYFYTRDINTLLSKKRKAFSVKYYDDLIYDECKERLKGYFKKKDSASLMSEIKLFYTKFKNFPRNFHSSFFHIINSNIRKHRRIEYMRVFHGVNLDEDKLPEEQNQPDPRDTSKNKEDKEFNIMELLGESFVQENYKDISDFAMIGVKGEKPKDSARSVKEIEENFRALWKAPENTVSDPNSAAFSNALYNKNYMLYSRSDSQTAEDILKQIVSEFKDGDTSSKASMTLADKVLHQVATSAATTSSKKQENRFSTTIRQRSGEAFEFSPLIQGSKKSLGSSGNFNGQPQPMLRQQSSVNINNTSTRGQSNPRNNSRGEVDTTNILGKVNQSKLYEQRKSTEKFSVEHLNDIVINRNKILSNLYQFRSTRSKSGGLKSVGSTSKTPSHKNGTPLGVIGEANGFDIQDSRHPQAPSYINEKSLSPSPDKRIPKEEIRPMAEMIARPKPSIDLSTQNTIKRSASQGLNGEVRDVSSPMVSQISQPIQHKKTNSVIKKRGVATPVRSGVNPIQSFTVGNNSSIQNVSNQDTTVSPVHGKFINPLRSSLGNTQQYYFRHPSPVDEKISHASGAYQKGVSEPMIKNLNIRSMKHTSPNRTDNNYRVNTLSLSGRQQNQLDLSQGVTSFGGSHISGQLNKTNPDQLKVKKIEKANMQAFAAKIIKRASLAPNQIITPVLELEENERKPKKILELSDSNYNGFRDLRLPSKEHTPMNIGPSSTSSLNKFKVEMRKNTWSSYTVKGGSKDAGIRLVMKK